MQSLQAWGKGKPILLVLFAREVASGTDAVAEFLELLHTGKGLKKLGPPPSLDQWLEFHRRPWRAIRKVLDRMFPAKPGELKTSTCIRLLERGWRQLSQMTQDEIRELFAAIPEDTLREIMATIAEIVQELWRTQTVAEPRPNWDPELSEAEQAEMMTSPEMHYVLRSWACSLFLYGEPIHAIYIRACEGSLSDLEKLLRLDKAVVGDPRIAQQIAEASLLNRPRFSRIMKALKNPPPRMTAAKSKATTGALLMLVSEALNHPIAYPELKNLFDETAQAKSGNPIDPHVAAGETFYKRVSRRKPHWAPLLTADKTCPPNVRSPK